MGQPEEIESIKRLKARYFRTMDNKDWAGMREVFTDDVVVDTSAAGGAAIEGADAFLEFLEPALADAVTVHQGHMPEIELTSESTGRGVWALQDSIWWPDGTVMRGYGHYHETYEKRDGGGGSGPPPSPASTPSGPRRRRSIRPDDRPLRDRRRVGRAGPGTTRQSRETEARSPLGNLA